MPSTYMLWDVTANKVILEGFAPSTVQAHASPTRLIVEFPLDMGVNFYTVRLLPTALLFEAHERWIRNVRHLEHDH